MLLETSQDTLNVKAGSIGIRKAFETLGIELPIMISGTIEPMGTTLAGQNIESFYISLEHLKPISIGLELCDGSGIYARSYPYIIRNCGHSYQLLSQCRLAG